MAAGAPFLLVIPSLILCILITEYAICFGAFGQIFEGKETCDLHRYHQMQIYYINSYWNAGVTSLSQDFGQTLTGTGIFSVAP